MSKSGLYAHFGSKEELQLATVTAAEEVFDADVVEPAMEIDDGLARVEALCERFLSHVERAVSSRRLLLCVRRGRARHAAGPGARPESPPSSLAWAELVAAGLRAAQTNGEIDPDASIEQLTFELNAMLAQANTLFVLHGNHKAFDLARRAIRDRVDRATSADSPRP